MTMGRPQNDQSDARCFAKARCATVEELNAVLRQDFLAFVQKSFNELNGKGQYIHNYHIEAMVHVLERWRRGESKRLIINVQPRSLKSFVTSIAWAAFILGHDPTCRIMHFTIRLISPQSWREIFGGSSTLLGTGSCFRR
jgi:hypothetical protein